MLEVTQLVSGGIRLPIISFASLWLNPFSEESLISPFFTCKLVLIVPGVFKTGGIIYGQ